MKKLIIFVCNGNIHRSVIASQCLKDLIEKRGFGADYVADSYGLQGTMGTDFPKHRRLPEYPEEWRAAELTLKEFGIDISGHDFQMITAQVMAEAAAVVAMDDKVYSLAENSLLKQFPEDIKKVHRFSELTLDGKPISDPSGSGSKELHREIIKNIYSVVKENYEGILAWAG